MRPICNRVREKIATGGPGALSRDAQARHHVEACAECSDFLDGAAAVEASLAGLSPVEPPEAVVARLRDRLDEEPTPAKRRPRWIVTGGAAIAALLLLVVFVPRTTLLDELFRETVAPPPPPTPQTVPMPREPVVDAMPAPVRVQPARADSPSEQLGLQVPPAASGLWVAELKVRALPYPTPGPPPSSAPLVPGSPVHRRVAHPTSEGFLMYGTSEQPPRAPTRLEKPSRKTSRGGSPGGLSVRVLDEEGTPLPGATVTISHARGLVKTTATLSDRHGRAGFPVLRPGDGYSIHVNFPGNGPIRHDDLRVLPRKNLEISVRLSEAILERVKVTAERQLVDLESTEVSTRFSEEFIADLPVPGRHYQNVLTMTSGVNDPTASVHASRDRDFAGRVGGVSNVNPNSIEEIEIISAGAGVEYGRAQGGFARIPTLNVTARDRREAEVRARAFFATRDLTEDVRTQPATGYWANTYAPGDSSLRFLEARLASRLPAEYERFRKQPLRLHEASSEPARLLDSPAGAGLAVHAHADRSSVEGPGRILMQVGLKGSPAAGRRRTAMNLALLLDLRGEVPIEVATSLRSLIDAFSRARETGDRFHLLVAGRSGGVVAEPDRFRRGVLTVTLDQLLNEGGIPDAPILDLTQALEQAIDRVSELDDSEAPLGSSAVVLITGGAIGTSLDAMESTIRESAVRGITLSVIGAGGGVRLEEIDRLVLAGQGNRRLIRRPAEAGRLVDRELSAVGRVVARAVRIEIRLAPGVRLIDMPGSHRLDRIRTDQVRKAEKSIDRRVARNLGIQADRGQDDAGIQIVLPSFYSGDTHAVLLDLAVPGPGPVADVTARFKDLVRMRNGVAMVELTLDDGDRPAGPQQHAVLKSLLALRLAETLRRAADQLQSGQDADAVEAIRNYGSLLYGIRLSVPGLRADRDLDRDVAMLDEYAGLLEAGAAAIPALRGHLVDSLRYAGLLKVSPRPSRSSGAGTNGGRHG